MENTTCKLENLKIFPIENGGEVSCNNCGFKLSMFNDGTREFDQSKHTADDWISHESLIPVFKEL